MVESDLSKERLIGSRELITCVCPHCNSKTIPYYEKYDELKNSPSHIEYCTECRKPYSFMIYEGYECGAYNYITRSFPLFEYRFIYGHVMRCPDSGDYYGHILGTKHGMNFAGETLELAEQDFRIIVDTYIDEVMRDQEV